MLSVVTLRVCLCITLGARDDRVANGAFYFEGSTPPCPDGLPDPVGTGRVVGAVSLWTTGGRLARTSLPSDTALPH